MGYGGRRPLDPEWIALGAQARDASHPARVAQPNTNAGPGFEPDPAISET